MSVTLIAYDGDGRLTTMDFIKEWSDSFAKQYGAEFLICHISKVTGEDLAGADVLMLVRCTTPYAAFVCAEYKKSGGTLIAFYDDDLLNPPPAINYRLRNARKKAVLGILRHADILMSGNKYLMDKYSKIYGTGRVVLADAIGSPADIAPAPADKEEVRIVYAGGHSDMFGKFVRPVLNRLDDEFGAGLSLTFIGVNPGPLPGLNGIRTEMLDWMPAAEYRAYMEKGAFDIGISPLQSDEFAKCKYYNKFVEYAKYGIAGVYSDVEPYSLIVENGVNGLLANNTPDGWYEALSLLIRNSELRKACAAAATEQLRRDFNSRAINRKIAEQIPELTGGMGGAPANKDAKTSPTVKYSLKSAKLRYYYPFVAVSKAGSVFFYLRRGGIMGLIRHSKAWIKARS